MHLHLHQGPPDIIGDIGGDAHFRTRLQQPRRFAQQERRDDAPLVMAFFRPRVGVEYEKPVETVRRHRLDQRAPVAMQDTNICEILFLDLRQQLGDAVVKWLCPDDERVPVAGRLPGEMLAAAETDLQPDSLKAFRHLVHSGSDIIGRNCNLRQQIRHQPLLARL